MSALRRSTRKRSSASVASSSQVAEILNLSDDENEGKTGAHQRRAALQRDGDYVPSRSDAADSADAEMDAKHSDGRLRKRRNSTPNASADGNANSLHENESDADAEAKNAAREIGPLSDRARKLPAGTHAAVSAHAHALFELAVAAEQVQQNAPVDNVAVAIEIDAASESDEGAQSPASSNSAGASSLSSSADSSSDSSSSSNVENGGGGDGEAGLRDASASNGDEKAEDDSTGPAQPDSPGLAGELGDEAEPPSPLHVDYEHSQSRMRGLSASPAPLRLPSPMPAGSLAMNGAAQEDEKEAAQPAASAEGKSKAATSQGEAKSPSGVLCVLWFLSVFIECIGELSGWIDDRERPQAGQRRPRSVVDLDRQVCGLLVSFSFVFIA